MYNFTPFANTTSGTQCETVVCPAVRICGYRDHRNGTHFEFFLLPSCEQHYYRYLRAARCEVRGAQLFLVARMYAKILFYK